MIEEHARFAAVQSLAASLRAIAEGYDALGALFAYEAAIFGQIARGGLSSANLGLLELLQEQIEEQINLMETWN